MRFMPFSRLVVAALVTLTGHAFASDIDLKMTTATGGTKVSFQDSTATEVASVNSKGTITTSSNVVTGGYVDMPELTTIANPPADVMRLYAKDVGGTTYMAYRDSTGAERLIRPAAFVAFNDAETSGTNMGTTFKDVHYALDASKLASTVVDFTGYREARIVFAVDNSEADTIECRIYNVTDAAQVVTAVSDGSGNPVVVTGTWTSISLTGDKTVRAECREGSGATADPDIGSIVLQLR
jgi:hypothetical protein